MMIIRPSAVVTPSYLHSALTATSMKALLQRIGNGAAVRQLTTTQLSKLALPIPAIGMQLEYERKLRACMVLKRKAEQAQEGVQSLFASLQHRAFQGEL